MPSKYTKAVAVTPSDGSDLTTPADAIFVGDGCYTDSTTSLHTSLTTDAGEPEGWWRADNVSAGFMVGQGSKNTRATRASQGGVSGPGVDATGINGKPMMTFSTNKYLSISDSAEFRLSDDDFSLVIVFKLDAVDSEQFIWCKDNLNSDWGLYINSSGILNFKTSDYPDLATGSAISADTWYICEITKDGDDGFMYLNGVLTDTATNGFDTFDADLTDVMYIGCRQGASSLSRFVDGDIPEFIMWTGGSKLSSGDRTRLMGYLNDRYFNTTRFVDVSTIASGNTSNVDTDRLERGVVHPLKVSRIRSTGTNGSSIVALYE